MDSRYPLASTTWDNSEINAINKVINSGVYSMGKLVFEFENQFFNMVIFGHFGPLYLISPLSGCISLTLSIMVLDTF